ncbi:hypothetical protein FNV43_RR17425 [Rhamnella rubrinervis]|uniref:Uncharacterized protein n=1 Tax=Rhamnella rubrinervis TaxID=2594499 RepID=A0A8K0GXV7_9ROSA|nr:hypothetical protein FNV43_RR17425 [Rhamnella rubrinervis]
MPNRDSVVYTERTTTLRRSPRFLHQKTTPEQEHPTPLRKSPRLALKKKTAPKPEDLKTPNSKSRSSRVSSFDPSLSSVQYALKKSDEDFVDNIRRKSSKCNDGSRKFGNLSSWRKKSSVVSIGDDGYQCLRRSPRIASQRNAVACEHKDFPENIGKKSGVSDNGARNCETSSNGSKKSSRSCNGVDGFQSLRRSPRFFSQKNIVDDSVEVSGIKGISHNSKSKVELSDIGKPGVCVNSCERFVPKSEKARRRSSVDPKAVDAGGREMKSVELDDRCGQVEVGRKRKRDEEGNRTVHGWTKEQELALQRAYLVAKPTPHFWKKVSKLVPGKSAWECFNKVHSDHITPPQPRPLSRAKTGNNSSPLRHFQLSASKLIKPTKPKVRRRSCNNRKSRLVQKTVRQLLQRNYCMDKDHEVDFFSVLEPNLDISTQAFQADYILSTPKNLQGNKQLLQKCSERFSSGRKKPPSRFSNSCETALFSPPVLKQVKNRALHEKYIDQLHSREAKRVASSQHSGKSTSREGGKECHFQKVDVVGAAKSALVSEVRDAIDKLQNVHASATINDSDLDDDAEDGI